MVCSTYIGVPCHRMACHLVVRGCHDTLLCRRGYLEGMPPWGAHHGGHALKGMHDAPYHMGWGSHPVGYATLCSLLSAPGIGAWDADGMP